MVLETIRSFAADESGATAIEYALLGTLIGIALLATFAALGNSVINMMGAGAGGSADVITVQAGKL